MSSRAKIREWSRLFSEYALAQGATQALGVLAGLWLVNLLPVREYALYTFALSIFTFLSVFSDLGTSSALLYFRRTTRIAGMSFLPYVRAALALRRGLLAIGVLGGLTFMFAVGPDRGFGMVELATVGAVLVAAVWVQVGASTALLHLRVEGRYRESYLAELLGNALRLLGVAMMSVATLALAWLAMLVGAAGSLASSVYAGRKAADVAQETSSNIEPSGPTPLKAIVRYVLPMALSAAYFSIQGPLTVWLSAYFAGTDSIAQVGALGRLGLLFGLVSGFMGTVLIPRLSAVTDDAHYLRRYLQCWAVLMPFGVGVMVIAYVVPEWLLVLLGPSYRDLADGVLLVAASATLAAWGGYIIAINNARGWVRHQPLLLVAYAFVQVILVLRLDLSTTIGVLMFGLWSNVAGLTLQAFVNVLGFLNPALVVVSGAQSEPSRG